MQLPLKLSSDLMETRWKSILDPVIETAYTNKNDLESLTAQVATLEAKPINKLKIIENVSLVIGANTITHDLGSVPVGWMILDINAAATIYRSAALTATTITLTSNAVATIKLGVF